LEVESWIDGITANKMEEYITLIIEFLFKFGSKGIEDGQFNFPHGVVVDHLDRIIITDFDNDQVQVFNFDEKFLFKFGSIGVKVDNSIFHMEL